MYFCEIRFHIGNILYLKKIQVHWKLKIEGLLRFNLAMEAKQENFSCCFQFFFFQNLPLDHLKLYFN